MNYESILPYLAVFSIIAVILILARKIPKISFEEGGSENIGGKEGIKPNFLKNLFYSALAIFEKILRQVRIRILKFDTKLFSWMELLRKESAKKLENVNKMAHDNITKAIAENKPSKISHRLQFKMEEKKLLYIIARNPKKAENYKRLGMMYYENNNFEDAEASFAEYLKLNPDDFEAKNLLEKIKLSAGTVK